MRAQGFSLIETMIAAVLLSCGLLSVAALARGSHQLASLGTGLARSAELASARLARLEAQGCAAAAGSQAAYPFDEQWTVTRAPGLRRAEIRVRFAWQNRELVTVVRSAFLCLAELP